jgi:predicted outer membrane lipoprotein
MITFTELELVLLIAFGVMTAMWFRLRGELYMHRRVTAEIFMRIAKGNVKVIETEGGYELEVTAK